MKPLFGALFSLLFTTAALAVGYEDTPTAAWFKSLSSPLFVYCCNQADCKRADSEWRRDAVQREPEPGELVTEAGHYWAKSNQTGVWVEVPPGRITRDDAGNIVVSIFRDAILCERELEVPATSEAVVFCFAPKPEGY